MPSWRPHQESIQNSCTDFTVCHIYQILLLPHDAWLGVPLLGNHVGLWGNPHPSYHVFFQSRACTTFHLRFLESIKLEQHNSDNATITYLIYLHFKIFRLSPASPAHLATWGPLPAVWYTWGAIDMKKICKQYCISCTSNTVFAQSKPQKS